MPIETDSSLIGYGRKGGDKITLRLLNYTEK
jgi:hypothetical protein